MANVQLSIDDELLKWLVILTCSLLLKMFVTNMYMTMPRGKARQNAPEDSALWKMLGVSAQSFGTEPAGTKSDAKDAKLKMDVKRAERMIQNDLENCYMGLIAIWMAGFCCSDADAVRTYATAYVALRYAFTVIFAFGVPLLRSVAFMAGNACAGMLLYMSLTSVGAL